MSQSIQKRDFRNEDENTLYPKNGEKIKMTGNGEIPKSGTATAIIPQYPSKEFYFTTSYWNGSSEEERKIRLKMYEDSGNEWLSFIDQNDVEFLTLRKSLTGNAYDLISRQTALETSPKIGCVEDVGDNDIVSYVNKIGVNGGKTAGSFTGNGDVTFARNVLSRKLLTDVEVLSENLLENSDMTDWYLQAEDWGFDDLMQGSFPTRTDDASVGSYAVLLNGNENEDSSIEQEQITVTPEEEYAPSLDVKDGTAYYSISYESGVELYSFRWTGINAGTWQLGIDDDSDFECVGGVGSYSTITPTSVTIPAGITEVAVEIFSSGTAKVDNVKLVNESEVDVMTNGSFETWENLFPEDYLFTSFTETSNGEIEKDETTYHSETASAKIIAGANPSDYAFLSQGAITEYKTKFSVWLKAGTATTARYAVFALGADDDNYKIYNFSGVNAGTWTLFSSVGAEQIASFSLTSSWEQYTFDNIPFNENEQVTPILLTPAVEGQYYYIDDFELKEYERPAVNFHNFKIKENYSELFPDDTVLRIETADGQVPFQVKKGCVFDTVDDAFDFEEADIPTKVRSSYEALSGALNKYSGDALLGLVKSVDLKDTVETYDFNFELPVGSYIINPKIVMLITSADSLSGDATFSITNSESALIENQAITLTAPLGQISFDASSGIGTLLNSADGGTITLQITGADSGTSGIATFYLFGTIYDETINGNGEQL